MAMAMAARKTQKGGAVPDGRAKYHKVIRFGQIRSCKTEEEEGLFQYIHQRADLQVSKGSIPLGFLSVLAVEEGDPIYLETKDGGNNERGHPIGPMYQVTFRKERKPIGGSADGWSGNLDDLWCQALTHFERKHLLGEETLVLLDYDPFVLFGIDDPITQQAIEKLQRLPALFCEGKMPKFEEWSQYLRVDPGDKATRWLVQAFAETELPKPWSCYKGIGSIVCFIHADSGEVTWRHPFYEHFQQLHEFCKTASREEVMKVRINRLLWSYEASRVETEHDQEPLLCPDNIIRLAQIFGFSAKRQGYLVRNLKAFLKVFSRSYREKQDIDINDVIRCFDVLSLDVDKHVEMRREWESAANREVDFDLNQLASGKKKCVNCNTVALCFCLECKDYLCLNCYDSLHNKGARRDHAPFRLVTCELCDTMPAKLHCNFTDKSLCNECYAMKHIKALPLDGKENQPRRIDYKKQYHRYAQFARDRRADAAHIVAEGLDNYESVLSVDWHPFYDARGVKYYHNFTTGERMRQSPRRIPNEADPGANLADSADNMALTGGYTTTGAGAMTTFTSTMHRTGMDTFGATAEPLSLTGFDSLKTDPAAIAAAAHPDARLLRPPYRVAIPHEVPA
mmetsp:Transcript_34940/g.81755  ORF Transcript_34940/g.81755 Transcript_34940/m.81755 type:complete len:623 (+) Transcript_34940:118-1986(+)